MTTSVEKPLESSAPRTSNYNYDDLIACGEGRLFSHDAARLPLPPMLMFDSITKVSNEGGAFNNGEIIAEKHISADDWFFSCHFQNDPVMPGCLGLDAMWQLIGFFITWNNIPGQGRALGSGKIKFRGQILPETKHVIYFVSIKKLNRLHSGEYMAFANAHLDADGKTIYKADDLCVGVFNLRK